jgi:hypothetical protein
MEIVAVVIFGTVGLIAVMSLMVPLIFIHLQASMICFLRKPVHRSDAYPGGADGLYLLKHDPAAFKRRYWYLVWYIRLCGGLFLIGLSLVPWWLSYIP